MEKVRGGDAGERGGGGGVEARNASSRCLTNNEIVFILQIWIPYTEMNKPGKKHS